MVKRLKYIILSLLLSTSVTAGNKYALTVFISEYPHDSGWNTLNSDNDKSIIIPLLRSIGFTEAGIICLEDEDATYSNIVNSLERLSSIVCRGDQVYVHFSCHGQQITDLNKDEALIDPKDKYDEALVPYDAAIAYDWKGYKGDKHLLDDTLNRWLNIISNKVGREGCVLMIADACHSGDLERTMVNDEYIAYRGTFDRFELPLRRETRVEKIQEVKWITISACKDFQTNYECEFEGKKYGRLSFAISRCLRKNQTGEDLVSALREEYSVLPLPKGKAQTLVVESPEKLLQKFLFK